MSSTKTSLSDAHKFESIMKKYIEIPFEALERLVEGRYVEGSLHRDQYTGKIIFKAFNRKPRGSQDRLICQLENGWLKESPKRIKFFNSVKKELGLQMVDVVMHRELKTAMSVMEIEEILDNV